MKIGQRSGKVAALVGALTTLVAFLAVEGLPPLASALDPIIWFALLFVALCGAFASYSTFRALREIARHRAWLVLALAGAVFGGWPRSVEFVRDSREAARFVLTADTTTGQVFRKYIRGGIHLFVRFHSTDRVHELHLVGENPYFGRPAYSTFTVGDSVLVYYRPDAPEDAIIAPPGPELRLLVQHLLKMCTVFAILFAAYVPPVARFVQRKLPRATT